MSIASICVLVSCLVLTGAAELISVNIEKEVDSVGKTNEYLIRAKTREKDTYRVARHTAKSHKIRKVEILVIQIPIDKIINIIFYHNHICNSILFR